MKPLIQKAFLISQVAMHKSVRKENPSEPAYTKKQYQDFIDLKKARVDHDKKFGPLYRNIGMTLSLLIVIIAFNWRSQQTTIIDLGKVEDVSEEIIDIPISEQTPPPPPKATEVFTIVEVPDTEVLEEVEIALDIEVTEETVMEEVVVTVTEEVEKEVVEEVFSIVEVQPHPEGGLKAFNQYLAANLKYPRSAERLGVSGKVFVKFVVEKDGSLTDFQVLKGIGAGCDEEAIRVLSEAPNWVPGKQRGMPVRVYKVVPIIFILQES